MVQTLIRLPFEGATTVTQSVGGAASHSGNTYFAYDFDLDFGQRVLAVAAGRVVSMRETVVDGGAYSYSGDPSLGPSNIGNFVTLEHIINGEKFYSSYFHLRQGSVPLVVGAWVDEGEVLGQVGNTGVRSGTHLHFQFGASAVQWQAGIVANAAVTSTNLAMSDELRFIGYDGNSALGRGSAVRGGAAGDLPANTGTEAVLALNGTGTGSIGLPRDMDWFRIDVKAGQSYTVTVDAASGSSLDAFLRLHDSQGRLIATDDTSGPGWNAKLTFTAQYTTHLFLSAGGYGNSTGNYVVGFVPRGIARDGTAFADRMTGGAGADTLWGGGGSDVIYGLDGNDRLMGGTGQDAIYGGNGRDRLDGDSGNDTMSGGSGADVFVFQQADGRDTVRDFQNGVDRISVEGVRSVAGLTAWAGVGGTWLDYGNGEVFLQGVSRSQLDSSDFIFA